MSFVSGLLTNRTLEWRATVLDYVVMAMWFRMTKRGMVRYKINSSCFLAIAALKWKRDFDTQGIEIEVIPVGNHFPLMCWIVGDINVDLCAFCVVTIICIRHYKHLNDLQNQFQAVVLLARAVASRVIEIDWMVNYFISKIYIGVSEMWYAIKVWQ